MLGDPGSGKTTLLYSILGETTKQKGMQIVKGKIALVDKSPFILSDTLLGNILFGNELDPKRLEFVLKYTTLSEDLSNLPQGLQTMLHSGSKLITEDQSLRMKLSLARAIYSNADVYLLDDPLSAIESIEQAHFIHKHHSM